MKLLVFIILIQIGYGLFQECPYGFTKNAFGRNFTHCYADVGKTESFYVTSRVCTQRFTAHMILPKDNSTLDDLYELFKAFNHLYFWIGATSSPERPKDFVFNDGTRVPKEIWCPGYPNGEDNLCAYYSTFVEDKKCIKSGECNLKHFKAGMICQAN